MSIFKSADWAAEPFLICAEKTCSKFVCVDRMLKNLLTTPQEHISKRSTQGAHESSSNNPSGII